MRFLHLLWKKYTLLCILTLTGLPLTILGWAGRNGLYKDLAFTPLTQPGLTLVMEGIHEGIYPWGDLFERGKKEDASQEASTEESAAVIASEAVSDEAVTAGTASTAGTGTASGAASGTGATTRRGGRQHGRNSLRCGVFRGVISRKHHTVYGGGGLRSKRSKDHPGRRDHRRFEHDPGRRL